MRELARRGRPRRRVPAKAMATVGLLALLAATGCTETDPSPDVAETVERTVAAGGARVEVTAGLAGDEGPGLDVRGTGGVDFEQGAAELSFRIPGEEGPVRAVFVSEGAFVRLGEEAATPWVDASWGRLAVTRLPQNTPIFPVFYDPVAAVRLLGSAEVADGAPVEEEVRGVATTKHRVVVDLEAAREEASEGLRERIVQATSRFAARRVPFTIWIDDEGRLRRLVFRSPVATPPSPLELETPAASDGLETTFEFPEFGVDVEVEPPEADNTTPLITPSPEPTPD